MNDSIFDTTLPEAILACYFIEKNLDIMQIDELDDSLFQYSIHSTLFQKIKKSIHEGNWPDFVNAVSLGFTSEELTMVMATISKIESIRHYPDYVRQLKENIKRRKILDITEKPGFDFESIREILKTSESNLKVCSTGNLTDYISYREDLASGKIKRFNIGFPKLEKQIGKFREGRLVVIGARTARGKTSLALQLAYNLAEDKENVLYLTSEMTEIDLKDRLMSQISEIDYDSIQNPERMTPEEKKSFIKYLDVMYASPFDLIEVRRFRVSEIRKLMQQKRYTVLIVDYLQRFYLTDNAIKNRNEAAIISEICNTIKDLSLEFNCLTFLPSQIDREKEGAEEHLILSDLKGSGGIEESADCVWFIESRKPILTEKESMGGKTVYGEPTGSFEDNFHIAKNRFGRTGDVLCNYKGKYCKFTEY